MHAFSYLYTIMRTVLTTLTAWALSAVLCLAGTPASDPCFTYTGRTLVQGGDVSFDWSGVTVKVKFMGRKLSMDCSDNGTDWFNCWIDEEPAALTGQKIKVSGNQTIKFDIPFSLKKNEHTVVLQKRTEGEQGRMTIHSFSTDGEFLQAEGHGARHIEFIGDSYTCGYGTEASDRNQPFRAEEENCNLAYDNIIGRYFDADVTLIAHSGRGIIRNYGGYNPEEVMVNKYSQVFDQYTDPAWTPTMSGVTPDIVVIYLGTNDFSEGQQPSINSWCANYATLLKKIRANYGDSIPILCVASKADDLMGFYVETAVRTSGQTNVHWTSIQPAAHNDSSDLGAGWHPNYSGQRKVAACMIPYISTLTGWEMPLKAIE